MNKIIEAHRAEVNHSLREIILVLCIVLFSGIIRIPSLTQPLGPDQGIMAVIGRGILQGGLPYKDYWEMASPAIFFTYALMFKVFGTTMAAIPITDTLVSMLTTFLIFLLARSLWGKNSGYISALIFAFFSNGVRLGMHAGGDIAFGTFWYIAQRETFMLPLIAASYYFILGSEREEKKSWRLVLSGFLAGLTFVYKFPALLFFLCLILYLNGSFLLNKVQRPVRILLIKNWLLIFGFILAIVPFILFFSFKGAMKEMTEVIFRYVYSVYGQSEHDYLGIFKTGFLHTAFIAKENFILWFFFITSSIYIIANERTKENLLIMLWGLASVLFIISHREFFGYHYLVILPPFSMLAGYGIMKAFGTGFNLRQIFTQHHQEVQPGKAGLNGIMYPNVHAQKPWMSTCGAGFIKELGWVFIIFTLLTNLIFFATFNYMHYTKSYYYLTGKLTQEDYYKFFSAYPKHDYSFPADYEVAQYIKKHTTNNDMIFSLGGIESVIYFLTERKSPSRFIFSWILFSFAHSRVEHAEVYRNELLNDLRIKTPKYIITVRSLEAFKQFYEIYNFIKNNYTLQKVFPDDRFVYIHNKNI